MLQPERKFNARECRFGFNGKENDNDIKGLGNQVDFGNRIYDTRLGRPMSSDKFTNAYPGLSPYNGLGNNPISNIDIDGNLIIYCGGYWPGNDNTPQLENSDYWDIELVHNAAAKYNDFDAMFFNGSSNSKSPLSSTVGERASQGAEAAALYAFEIKRELNAERKTNPNAKIHFISHSMGTAYSEGFVNALFTIKDKEGNNLFSSDDFGDWIALAPYQPENISAPSMLKTTKQYSASYDPVAGDEKIWNLKNSNYSSKPYDGVPAINAGLRIWNIQTHFNSTFKDEFKKAPENTKVHDKTPAGKGNSGGTGNPSQTKRPKNPRDL